MKAPFPWFGGKRRVAPVVWEAFGDVDNYVEPFAGSLAVLLERPLHHKGIQYGAETVNDADAYLCNFWRAVIANPDEVTKWVDWPVNETDLLARHMWLVNAGRERIARLEADPDFYDAKVAGWWVWGLSAWIGNGWCSGKGPWSLAGQERRIKRQLPHLGSAGQGVNRKRPHLGDAGKGVNRKLPSLHNAGAGINRSITEFEGRDSGCVLDPEQRHIAILGYMRALQARLRRVRVCCGDWSRVMTEGALSYGSSIGVFLDPPYDEEVRTRGLYAVEGGSISHAVRKWALDHGDDPRFRIALCGYEGEHEMPPSWRVYAWVAGGAYLGSKSGGVGRENRFKERIWFSPRCLAPDADRQCSLFAPDDDDCSVEAEEDGE